MSKIGLRIEVNRIRRRRGRRRVAVGQSSDRKHVCVGRNRLCMPWPLHDKNWEVFPDLHRKRTRMDQISAVKSLTRILPTFSSCPSLLISGRRRLPTSPSSSTHQTTFFTPHTPFNPLATHLTGNPARFLTNRIYVSTSLLSTTTPHHTTTYCSLYIYTFQLRINHGQMCVFFSFVWLVILGNE